MTEARKSWPDGGADAMERELLVQWERESLFERVQEATASGKPWVFFEGPPTANGRPGIHHVFARTIKDMVCRYQVMLGHRVTRTAGWDTHGLPVELEVEKQLGFKGKKDIEEFGVAEFNRRCLESVFTYRDEWVDLSNRIGYWLDYDRAYVTCTKEYIESVWWLLKQLHEKTLLYRGHRVLPYCPRCGTTLSSHELALGYQEVRDKSIYVTFPMADGRELVVWTTTPWTLPSNVAVAVHPELEYSTWRLPDGRQLVAASARAAVIESIFGEGVADVVRTEPGAALAGLTYTRPLDVVPLPEHGVHSVVVTGEFVTATDGSGLVHMAPAFGADDYAAGQANGLALLRPVAADGTFTGTTWPELEGQLVTADATNELIIRKLKELGRHLRTEQYVHSYPHCWRCNSKLIYYARDSWFVRTSSFKERMSELNGGVEWHPPDVGRGRFGEWLSNNIDWALSRERYWGTPLPIWVNDRDPSDVVVIGSYEELKQRTGFTPSHDLDVHKPWVDEITWPAADGGTMRRVPEVIDTWFDSGAMPYAQWHYPFENREQFDTHFPADYICEGIDQTRGWFYSLLAISTAVRDESPYRNVIVNELVLDAKGQKMSKSKGNAVNPWDVVQSHGADAARLYLVLSSQVWQPKRFDPEQLRETAGKFLITLRNTYQFFALYAGASAGAPPAAQRPMADRWILGRLDATVSRVRAAFDDYDVTAATRAIADFVDADLSNWYVRLNRDRFWAPDGDADAAAVATLEEVLITTARLLAPAAPFASDWMHRALTGESVHLAAFPESQERMDLAVENGMAVTRLLASLARAARETARIPVRQPLRQINIAGVGAFEANPFFAEFCSILKTEANVRSVQVVGNSSDLVQFTAAANFRTLGKVWGKRMPEVAEFTSSLAPGVAQSIASGVPVNLSLPDGTPIVLTAADLMLKTEVMTTWPTASQGMVVVALDPVLTPELAEEGIARELISRIQRLRKDTGFDVSTRIALSLTGSAVLLGAARKHQEYIAHETLAREFTIGTQLASPDRIETVAIDEHAGELAVRRYGEGRTLSGPPQVDVQ